MQDYATEIGHWSFLAEMLLNISQGSVTTHLRCGGNFDSQFVTSTTLTLGLQCSDTVGARKSIQPRKPSDEVLTCLSV